MPSDEGLQGCDGDCSSSRKSLSNLTRESCLLTFSVCAASLHSAQKYHVTRIEGPRSVIYCGGASDRLPQPLKLTPLRFAAPHYAIGPAFNKKQREYQETISMTSEEKYICW